MGKLGNIEKRQDEMEFKGSNPKSKVQIANICSKHGFFFHYYELLGFSGADLVTPSGEVANFNRVNSFIVLFTSKH